MMAMSKARSSADQIVAEMSDKPRAQRPDAAAASGQIDADQSGTAGDAEGEALGVVELRPSQPLAIRETQRLYRLKSARFLAIVAADTEAEARSLAARHDAFRGDWCNEEFASCECEDTADVHVFGDVVFSARGAVKA
jgi:hypothetical protein